jgi:hypothetical protein
VLKNARSSSERRSAEPVSEWPGRRPAAARCRARARRREPARSAPARGCDHPSVEAAHRMTRATSVVSTARCTRSLSTHVVIGLTCEVRRRRQDLRVARRAGHDDCLPCRRRCDAGRKRVTYCERQLAAVASYGATLWRQVRTSARFSAHRVPSQSMFMLGLGRTSPARARWFHDRAA